MLKASSAIAGITVSTRVRFAIKFTAHNHFPTATEESRLRWQSSGAGLCAKFRPVAMTPLCVFGSRMRASRSCAAIWRARVPRRERRRSFQHVEELGIFYGYAIDPERADNDAVNRRLFRVVPLGSHAENITQDPRHAGASGRFRSADDVVTMTEASANSRNPLPVQKCRAWVLNLACVHKPEATITRGLCRNGSCGSRGGIRV
jgi:hypothetical protein